MNRSSWSPPAPLGPSLILCARIERTCRKYTRKVPMNNTNWRLSWGKERSAGDYEGGKWWRLRNELQMCFFLCMLCLYGKLTIFIFLSRYFYSVIWYLVLLAGFKISRLETIYHLINEHSQCRPTEVPQQHYKKLSDRSRVPTVIDVSGNIRVFKNCDFQA